MPTTSEPDHNPQQPAPPAGAGSANTSSSGQPALDEGVDAALARMPENAYRELRPGEVYQPLVADERPAHEVTARSIGFGLANAVVWSAAVSYLTLKLGQGLEAAVPISILAIGFSVLFRRRSTLLENMNVLALGATSGIVVGGSLFVMPAIHILKLDDLSSFFQVFFVPLLGAALGVLFLIPLRRYFVRDMHGKLPFPEGTAIAEVLVAGQRGGKQAVLLLKAMGIGYVFDLLTTLFRAWPETFTTAALGQLAGFTARFKAVFSLNTTAAIAGLGYLIGVRYAAFIMAGSLLSNFVLVPFLAFLGQQGAITVGIGVPPLGEMSHAQLFAEYARYMGIGAIFVAGLVSVLKMLPIMGQAIHQGLRGLAQRRRDGAAALPRTEQDIPISVVLGLIGLVVAAIWIYFRLAVTANQSSPTLMATLAVIIAVTVALLFSAVSAWAVAMISVTPISGMTLMTLIVSAVLLKKLGLSGREGMLGVLLIGGVVCTALSMTGTLVTEFKLSYWLGATPRKVQWGNIIGSVLSALVVTAVMLLLAKVYGFSEAEGHSQPLAAPQANAMAAVLRFLMETADATKWYLLALGGVIALIVEMVGVSPLAFALGMYIPMEYNSPILFGAIVAWFVRRSSPDPVLGRARGDRGILLASGLIAGGALAGITAAIVQFVESLKGVQPWKLPRIGFVDGDLPAFLALVMFVAVCCYLYFDSVQARREDAGPSLG
ncbi:MAG: oligopeptide transporter, OPT family [Pseudomonadota bacterium]